MTPSRQQTLKNSAAMSGPGLHTGEICELKLFPADPDTGIVFVTDNGEVRASADNVCGTQRGTTLRSGDAVVHTVEHLLAALAGLGIDNARVRVKGPELPAGDGSALPFVELAEEAGTEEQNAEVRTTRLNAPVWISDAGKYLLAVPSDQLRLSVLISFQHPMIGEQASSLAVDPEAFKREIAPARTFCTSAEIDAILAQGLGKGGTEENVVVAYDDRYSVPLRFSDELVRHKMLDLIGDLSLIGTGLYADVTAIKPSHTLNVALARRILQQC